MPSIMQSPFGGDGDRYLDQREQGDRYDWPIYAKDIEIAVDGRVYAIDEDYYYADVDVYDKDMKYLNSIRLTSYAGSP